MSDHEYFEQLCAVSIDGTLTDAERHKLEAHLAECPSCAALKRDLERMQRLLAEEQALPEGLHERIMDGVREEEQLCVVRPERPARRMPVFTMLAAAAAVVVIVLGGGIGRMFTGARGGSSGQAAADACAPSSADSNMALPAQAAGGMDGGVPADDAGRGGISNYHADAAPEEPAGAPAGFAAEEAAPDSAALETESAAKDAGGDMTEDTPVQRSTMTELPALPESLNSMSVAHCYMAQGTGELPDLGGELLAEADGVAYFSLQNSMGTIETTFAALEEAGYTVQACEDVGLAVDSKAANWLLIVVRSE